MVIEILVVLILIAIISALAGNSTPPATAPSPQQSGATTQTAANAQVVRETAHAGAAVVRMGLAAGANQPAIGDDTPAAAEPGIEATGADPAPDAGDGAGDILDGLFDGL
jgi:hypothetical protein